jgi:hypothetical protein
MRRITSPSRLCAARSAGVASCLRSRSTPRERRRGVNAVEYFDGSGAHFQRASADAFVLAASPDPVGAGWRLSPTPAGGALGSSSDQVGRNLMFHFQTNVNGFMPQRVPGQRGRAVVRPPTPGVEPGGDQIRVLDVNGRSELYLGICEFGGPQGLHRS